MKLLTILLLYLSFNLRENSHTDYRTGFILTYLDINVVYSSKIWRIDYKNEIAKERRRRFSENKQYIWWLLHKTLQILNYNNSDYLLNIIIYLRENLRHKNCKNFIRGI